MSPYQHAITDAPAVNRLLYLLAYVRSTAALFLLALKEAGI